MAIATQGTASNYLQRAPSPSRLADVIDLILDKGHDARIVIASVDTYLRFAEAVNRLDLAQTTEMSGLGDLEKKGAEKMTEGVIEGAEDKVLPDSSALRTTAKGAATAAAAGVATVLAKEISNRIGGENKH